MHKILSFKGMAQPETPSDRKLGGKFSLPSFWREGRGLIGSQ